MNKFIYIFLFNIFFIFEVYAQPEVLISDDDWTSNTNNGPCNCDTDFNNGSFINFRDAGGDALPYGPNEYETITLCPDSTGSKMVLAILNDPANGYVLNIHPTDTLYVYDGPTVNDPLLAAINDSTFPNGS